MSVGNDIWFELQSEARVGEAMTYGPPAVIASIYFATDESRLDSGDERTLAELDTQLLNHVTTFHNIPNEFTFKIIGYADGRGSKEDNFLLALKRAVNVERQFRFLNAVRHFRSNFSNFGGIDQVTEGEVGPEEGGDAELAEHRRVDIKVKGGAHEITIPDYGIPT